MNDVKRYNANVFFPGCLGPLSREVVLAELEAEAQALREEVAALRARVVVVPDRIDADAQKEDWYTEGWNACLDELARLNGKAVSEGLLRRVIDHLEWDGKQEMTAHDYVSRGDKLADELRTLLGEGVES